MELEGGLTANDDDLARETRVQTERSHGSGLFCQILEEPGARSARLSSEVKKVTKERHAYRSIWYYQARVVSLFRQWTEVGLAERQAREQDRRGGCGRG